MTAQPLYDTTAADLGDDPLADCPPPGPIDPAREPGLFDVALPTPAVPAGECDEEADS